MPPVFNLCRPAVQCHVFVPVFVPSRMPGLGCRWPVPFILSGGRPDFTEKGHDTSAFPSLPPPWPRSGEHAEGQRVSSPGARELSFAGRSLPSPSRPTLRFRRAAPARARPAAPSSLLFSSGPSRSSAPGAARPPSRPHSDFEIERKPVTRRAGTASAASPPLFPASLPRYLGDKEFAGPVSPWALRLSGLPGGVTNEIRTRKGEGRHIK